MIVDSTMQQIVRENRKSHFMSLVEPIEEDSKGSPAFKQNYVVVLLLCHKIAKTNLLYFLKCNSVCLMSFYKNIY